MIRWWCPRREKFYPQIQSYEDIETRPASIDTNGMRKRLEEVEHFNYCGSIYYQSRILLAVGKGQSCQRKDDEVHSIDKQTGLETFKENVGMLRLEYRSVRIGDMDVAINRAQLSREL